MKGQSVRKILLLVLALPVLGARSQAQKLEPPPLPVDPTPLVELITEKEKAELDRADNPKERTDEYLDIADAHLDRALATAKEGDIATSERELDIFNKAVAEALKVALSAEKGVRGMTKKIEKRLYKHIKTLEIIEKLFPVERLPFAEAAMRQTKQARVQALNATFDSGDILKDPSKKPESEPDKDGAMMGFGAPGTISNFKFQISNLLRPVRNPQPATRNPQIPGDYLNEEEDEHVRKAQEPDERAKVFMKIADRRLIAITGAPAPADKKAQKKAEDEEREWGPLPQASRAELLRQYARAIAEVMVKLEDAYERNPKSGAIPKALTILRDATDRHLQTLRSLGSQVKDESEAAALREALSEAETANQGARNGLKPQS
ncbi:MAG TPA: hypothetical protein VNO70_11270 [Blastocatellia bacterium]|nr:hypothetical protein [Blastocatellia bacterium]